MSKLQFDQHVWQLRRPLIQESRRRTAQAVEESAIEESRALLDRPVYPYDPRTVPKTDK
ncbi:hypothetical protein [Microvirga yunnanensis]|uniref:hypothetical protein n=1 Tax=Microvirga yunnanensis TaxID=2953740 RepID=UPI0021C7EAB0|nr:hypothetical protein [Microvirga sp. HBU65207]